MRGKVKFERKASDIGNVDAFAVTAVHTLSHEDFEAFSDTLLERKDFIAERAKELRVDEMGRCCCLLVLDEEENDGILVHSAGFDYARYTSYYPNAKTHLKNEVRQVAEDIAKGRFGEEKDGEWIVDFDDIKERFDLTVTPNNGIGSLLLEELRNRSEIDEVIASDDAFQIKACMPQISESSFMTLFSLMECGLEDVHLVDRDEEHELATIVELNQNTLTEQGMRDWADVLGAKVERIYEGAYGVQIEVSGCDAQRVAEFSFMLAGYVSNSQYDRWVNQSQEQGETDAIQRL